jgi:hypothetical protein
MTKKLSVNVEMAILLPLDVLANKLNRIDEELRRLNLMVLNIELERERGDLTDSIQERVELMHETLDSIRALVSGLPARYDIPRTSAGRYANDGDAEPLLEPDSSEYTPRKRPPEVDD